MASLPGFSRETFRVLTYHFPALETRLHGEQHTRPAMRARNEFGSAVLACLLASSIAHHIPPLAMNAFVADSLADIEENLKRHGSW